MSTSSAFRDWIRAQRDRRGLTQQQFAELIGVRYQLVQRWENGQTAPRPQSRAKIARALGLDLADVPTAWGEANPFLHDEERPVVIYALGDPDDGTVRYIGMTTQDPIARAAQHYGQVQPGQQYERPQAQWLAQLKAQGRRPHVHVLERVSLEQCREAEQRWIAHYATMQNSLTNGDARRYGDLASVAAQCGSITIQWPGERTTLRLEREGATVVATVHQPTRDKSWRVPVAALSPIFTT